MTSYLKVDLPLRVNHQNLTLRSTAGQNKLNCYCKQFVQKCVGVCGRDQFKVKQSKGERDFKNFQQIQ